MMTSSMASHGGPPFWKIWNIKHRYQLQLYKYNLTSPGNQILKLIYPSIFESVDQKLKMSEMLMAIVPVYSTSGIKLPVKIVCRELKMAAILKNLKY